MATHRYFHLHLVSDATGETLINVARAAAAQYKHTHSIEHIHSLIRTQAHADRALRKSSSAGHRALHAGRRAARHVLEQGCRSLGVPCVSVLDPVLSAFQSYLGTRSAGRVGAQHVLDADYFRRIEALNFSLAHDDGQLFEAIEEADARAGRREPHLEDADLDLPRQSRHQDGQLAAGAGCAVCRRRCSTPGSRWSSGSSRAQTASCRSASTACSSMKSDELTDSYVDRDQVTEEIAWSRKLCARQAWPIIDVTRRSIEETAAAVMALLAATETGMRLVLASGSLSRRALLENAGLDFDVVPADLDERAAEQPLLDAGASPEDCAGALPWRRRRSSASAGRRISSSAPTRCSSSTASG